LHKVNSLPGAEEKFKEKYGKVCKGRQNQTKKDQDPANKKAGFFYYLPLDEPRRDKH